MTELEVKKDRFYVLTVKQGKENRITLHSDMDSPVRRVKEYLKEDISPNNIELMTVEIKEDKFELKGVPWSTIAVMLVKE